MVTTIFGALTAHAEVDCLKLGQTITLKVKADKSEVLEIVSSNISAAPNCSCEVIKSAITASEADEKLVAAIVEAGITSSPENSRLISQCAIATAPDAASAVQMVLAKLDPNSGDSSMSSKDAKSPMQQQVADAGFNPLDFPDDGDPSNIGPRQGGPGGASTLRPGLIFDSPPVVATPRVTNPNFPFNDGVLPNGNPFPGNPPFAPRDQD